MIRFQLILIVLFFLLSCSEDNTLQIVIPTDSEITTQLTAKDLKKDIELASDYKVEIHTLKDYNSSGPVIFIGTSSDSYITQLLSQNQIVINSGDPGPRGGIWHKLDNKQIVLVGSNVQGMQYTVYDYSKEILGLDPLIDWTGHSVSKIDKSKIFDIPTKRIEPPVVPLLVYFENDVDELANLKKPYLEYDWESYTQMIDALVRLRYNGIQLFDMLGRPEFFKRQAYTKRFPDYQLRLSYVDSLINYAHNKGMKVKIDMALGYQIKPMDSQFADCWRENKQKWIETWEYYLTKTPLKKMDIAALRPRNQVWDWEYKSSCDEDKIQVFNEVYATLDSVLGVHKPGIEKVVICYHDGMEMFNNGFNPPEDWIIAWSDDGYSGFEYWPEDTRGYRFGTYMHAGFWKNHTVADPYPERIDTVMHKMFDEYSATAYCEVNGQQFRPFLLNIEAFSEVCKDPDSFTGSGFYQTWLDRYFPDSLQKDAIRIMHDWHLASFGKEGYVENLWEIREVISYLSMIPIRRPGKSSIAYAAKRVEDDISIVEDRFLIIKGPLYRCIQLYAQYDTASYFFHDQVFLPLTIFYELLKFERILHEMYRIKRTYEENKNQNIKKQALVQLRNAREQLKTIYSTRLKGDKNPKWKGWYDPAKRRPNNGFPTQEMLDQIEFAIKNKW